MKIDDKIRYKKLQYDSNREAPEIASLLLNQIDNYDILNVKKDYVLIKVD